MGWFSDKLWLLIPLGALLAFMFIRLSLGAISYLGSTPPDTEPGETTDVEPLDLRYRCVVCAAEVRITRMSDEGSFQPPRHCREDMQVVTEADSL